MSVNVEGIIRSGLFPFIQVGDNRTPIARLVLLGTKTSEDNRKVKKENVLDSRLHIQQADRLNRDCASLSPPTREAA